jgi:hypothetical protein
VQDDHKEEAAFGGKRLRRKEAAAFLTERGFKTSAFTLAKLATVGGGPEYDIYGNVAIYEQPVLMAWATGKLKRRRSTSSR